MLLKITESGITGNVSSILKDTVQYVPYQDNTCCIKINSSLKKPEEFSRAPA